MELKIKSSKTYVRDEINQVLLKYCFLTGAIVILLERSPADFKVLGVGKVVSLQGTQALDDHAPVYVVSIESCATGILVPGQVVLWPLAMLALYTPSATEQGQHSRNVVSSIPPGSQDDRLFNYGLQVLQLGVMLMQLNDTEREGDGDRSLINWKMLMLYFRCRPRGMKYAYEAMRFITCVKALYSEKTSHRILHGQFVNPRGGEGKNYANDLKMEHCIQDNKQSMRAMQGNKTLKAVQRSSSSSYAQKEFCIHFDKECDITPDSSQHTHACTTEDIRAMISILQNNKPFEFQAGRSLHSFPHVSKSPLDKLDVSLLHNWLTNHKQKLFSGEFELTGDSADEEFAEDSEDDDDSSEEDVDDC